MSRKAKPPIEEARSGVDSAKNRGRPRTLQMRNSTQQLAGP